jgi:hypothetical protein
MVKFYGWASNKSSSKVLSNKSAVKVTPADYMATSDSVRIIGNRTVISERSSQERQTAKYTPVRMQGDGSVRIVVNVSTSPKRESIRKAKRSFFGVPVTEIEDTSGR